MYTGGTKVGAKKVANLGACANLCIDTDGAKTFNFVTSTRSCTMYEESDDDLDTVKDSRSTAGYLECDD
jgi:hypothetical protein